MAQMLFRTLLLRDSESIFNLLIKFTSLLSNKHLEQLFIHIKAEKSYRRNMLREQLKLLNDLGEKL